MCKTSLWFETLKNFFIDDPLLLLAHRDCVRGIYGAFIFQFSIAGSGITCSA